MLLDRWTDIVDNSQESERDCMHIEMWCYPMYIYRFVQLIFILQDLAVRIQFVNLVQNVVFFGYGCAR